MHGAEQYVAPLLASFEATDFALILTSTSKFGTVATLKEYLREFDPQTPWPEKMPPFDTFFGALIHLQCATLEGRLKDYPIPV